jgi:hypothetical protein
LLNIPFSSLYFSIVLRKQFFVVVAIAFIVMGWVQLVLAVYFFTHLM